MNLSLDLVICTYNNATSLDKVFEAIARQQISTEVTWGVLVVNNNCSDDTVSVVDKYLQAGTIPNLRLILESQQGLNHARRCGVENTTGDSIAFVDDDCLLAPDWVERAARFAREHPDCGAFGGRVILDWEIPPQPYVRQYGYCFAQQERGMQPQKVDCLVGAGMIINRKILLATNWLEKQYLSDRVGKKLISGGDVELALRLSVLAELWYNPQCQLKHLIPAHRTEFKYLLKINYGLGTSQIFGDSLLWTDSYENWLSFALRQTVRPTKAILTEGIKAFLGKSSKAKLAMNASFVGGQWRGILRMILMERSRRGELLGRAAKSDSAIEQQETSTTKTKLIQSNYDQAPWKIINLELSQPISELTLPTDYRKILAVFCWQGIPLGNSEIAAAELPMNATQLLNLAVKTIYPNVGSQLLQDGFRGKLPVDRPEFFSGNPPDFQKLMELTQPLKALKNNWEKPTNNNISVVICTRDRPKQLKNCLRSLQNLKTSPREIIVVDNAPSSDATRKIVALFPQFKYILEPRPGLSIARNTGIRYSQGEIIAFTDDDSVVHPDWLTLLQLAFEKPKIMAVTGLMLPAELETEAQIRFYQNNFDTRWEYKPLLFDSKFFRAMQSKGVPVWRIGAGANMAFRSKVFQLVGGFNEMLGAGAAGCSEDSEIWYRILTEGWECRYQPTAVVFHYHRSDFDSLEHQMYHYMRGHIAALLVQFAHYQHWGNLRRISIALPKYYFKRLLRKYLKGDRQLDRTLKSEIAGCLAGIKYFWQHKSQIKIDYDTNSETTESV